MAYQTFTWTPVAGPTSTSDFSVFQAKFGDGYIQEVGDGINNESVQWPLTFMGTREDIKPIRDFIRDHSGFLPFLWQSPTEDEPQLFVVNQYKVRVGAGKCPTWTLDATFEQRFAP